MTKDNPADNLMLIAHIPPKNQNFIAIFGDGSGAELFCWLDSGEIADADGDIAYRKEDLQDSLQDKGFCFWLPLPDNFDFFFMPDKRRSLGFVK